MVRLPSYRRHKSGQARVTLGGKDFYLGTYGSKKSRIAYQRLIGEFVASEGRPPAEDCITVAELSAGFMKY